MNQWRPENWQKNKHRIFLSDAEWIVDDTSIAFEAGADAMLAAIKSNVVDAYQTDCGEWRICLRVWGV